MYTEGIFYTTKAYSDTVAELLLAEANRVACDLKLKEHLPINKEDSPKIFVSPFGFSYLHHCLGNVETKNWFYNALCDYKLSEVIMVNYEGFCQRKRPYFMLPISKVDTNKALRVSKKFLTAMKVDVAALDRDSNLKVEISPDFNNNNSKSFFPAYLVSWIPKQGEGVTFVELFLPTKTLLQLSVKKSQFINRPPIVITNLATLLAPTNVCSTILTENSNSSVILTKP